MGYEAPELVLVGSVGDLTLEEGSVVLDDIDAN